MTRTAEQLAITGTNWSIERGLVVPDVAERAGQEILVAIDMGHEMVALDHDQPKQKFKGYVISGWDSVSDTDAESPDFAFPSLYTVRQALEPFKDPKLIGDEAGYYDEGFANIVEAEGKVPMHVDNEPWSLVFVSLIGRVKARIKHRDDSKFTEEELNPGDALRIINPKAKKQRPKHKLTNVSGFTRVSYGEYTTQNS